MHYPSKERFKELASPGRVIPVRREVVADLLTPLTAFLRLDRDPSKAAYLLESVEGGEKWGRYSFIGVEPRATIKQNLSDSDDLLAEVCGFASRWTPVGDEGLPRFWGGLVGFLGYDVVQCIETLPRDNEPDLPTADAHLIEAGIVVALDSLRQRATVVCPVRIDTGMDVGAAYTQACAAIDAAVRRLRTPEEPPRPSIELTPLPEDPPSNLDEPQFCAIVERARDYIRAGDIIQVVLSRRFEVQSSSTTPFEIYRALRLTNPSPYMFYMRFDDYALVGASPEILVRREGDSVEVRPIAGTRRRGATVEEDLAIEAELLADPKELAEHVMLLDLGRNDVGRVAKTGTVEVTEKMVVERYSTVMHLVSSVVGTIDPSLPSEDVIRATFPAGTLSGAPKVRAMEIIEELEPSRRGVYGGAAGYIGYGGNLDLAIAIRSVLVTADKLYVQAGAGIVYDSVPAREFEETREKARGVLRAIRLAREAFGP